MIIDAYVLFLNPMIWGARSFWTMFSVLPLIISTLNKYKYKKMDQFTKTTCIIAFK